MGYEKATVCNSSTAKWGNTRLRVALVLDNTGSMSSSGKIGALISATKSLLSQLQSLAKTPDDVYVSIVPFVNVVNIGSSTDHSLVMWDDGTDSSWDGTNGTCSCVASSGTCTSFSGSSPRSVCQAQKSCSISGHNTQASCTGAGTCSISGNNSQSSCTAAHACSKSQYTTQSQCTLHSGTWNAGVWTPGVWKVGHWNPKNHNTWNGCVWDRGDAGAPNRAITMRISHYRSPVTMRPCIRPIRRRPARRPRAGSAPIGPP